MLDSSQHRSRLSRRRRLARQAQDSAANGRSVVPLHRSRPDPRGEGQRQRPAPPPQHHASGQGSGQPYDRYSQPAPSQAYSSQPYPAYQPSYPTQAYSAPTYQDPSYQPFSPSQPTNGRSPNYSSSAGDPGQSNGQAPGEDDSSRSPRLPWVSSAKSLPPQTSTPANGSGWSYSQPRSQMDPPAYIDPPAYYDAGYDQRSPHYEPPQSNPPRSPYPAAGSQYQATTPDNFSDPRRRDPRTPNWRQSDPRLSDPRGTDRMARGDRSRLPSEQTTRLRSQSQRSSPGDRSSARSSARPRGVSADTFTTSPGRTPGRSSRQRRSPSVGTPSVSANPSKVRRLPVEANASSPQPRSSVRRRPYRPSPFVYLLRIAILVVGVGAVVGTALSIVNPSLRSAQGSLADDTALINPSPENVSSPVPTSLAHSFLNLSLEESISPLRDAIASLATEYPDLTPGVFVLDLDTGNYVDLNGAVTFSAASMIKVPVLISFFEAVDAGRIDLNETMIMEQADLASGSGTMQFDGVGTEYPILDVATLMIVVSDNSATNMLIRRLGGIEVVNQSFQNWGLRETEINNLLPDLEGTNTMTPRELVQSMTLISQGEILSLRSRDRMLDIMRRTVTDTLIPSGVSDPDATIAHKTGDIGSLVGDVGLVDMPNGKRYAIATVVQRPHNDNRAQDLIRRMNAEIYDYLMTSPEQVVEQPSPSLLNESSDGLESSSTPD